MNVTILRCRAALLALAVGTAAASTVASAATPELEATSFAKRSGSSAKTLFTAVPSAESGLKVENPYDDPAMWGEKYVEFQGGAIGSGIAVGDIDGDGLADVYVANKTRPNQLFRQVAPFNFEDITEKAGVAGPAGVKI
jgi:enediyne biosynthesis protein E4